MAKIIIHEDGRLETDDAETAIELSRRLATRIEGSISGPIGGTGKQTYRFQWGFQSLGQGEFHPSEVELGRVIECGKPACRWSSSGRALRGCATPE